MSSSEAVQRWSPERKALTLTTLLSLYFTIQTAFLNDTFDDLTHFGESSDSPLLKFIATPFVALSHGHEWVIEQNTAIHQPLLKVLAANAEISAVLGIPLYFSKVALIKKLRSQA